MLKISKVKDECGMDHRINTIGEYLKDRFGCKVIKLSLEGGFTCPNRDGTKGTGGCIFCSADGSGDTASSICAMNIREAMREQIELRREKWPDAKYLAYFQSYTNTYADVKELREKYEAALENDVLGIAIATRPDCLSDEVVEYLDELNRKTFMWVELGLQSASDETGRLINRCYDRDVYEDAVRRLSRCGIRIVTHLIFGLPGETKEDMLESVRYVCRPFDAAEEGSAGLDGGAGEAKTLSATANRYIFGIKLHLLNVVRGSGMEKKYPGYVPFESIDEYTDLVVSALRIIPPEITVHRMTADTPRKLLIAPEWSYQKRTILNNINNKMVRLDACQGDLGGL